MPRRSLFSYGLYSFGVASAAVALLLLVGCSPAPVGTPVTLPPGGTTFTVSGEGTEVVIGNAEQALVDVDTTGAAVIFASVDSPEDADALCADFVRDGVSGDSLVVGCPSDAYYGALPPGIACLSGECRFELSIFEPRDWTALRLPDASGGSDFTVRFEDTTPPPTTTTTSTTTTAPTTTSAPTIVTPSPAAQGASLAVDGVQTSLMVVGVLVLVGVAINTRPR